MSDGRRRAKPEEDASSRARSRVGLSVVVLDDVSDCDGCYISLPAGEVAIYYSGGGVSHADVGANFCVECISGVSLEAAAKARFEKRARPIRIRIREKGTDAVAMTFELQGGTAIARRLLEKMTENVDRDHFWVDLSELEEREAVRARPGTRRRNVDPA